MLKSGQLNLGNACLNHLLELARQETETYNNAKARFFLASLGDLARLVLCHASRSPTGYMDNKDLA